MERRTAKVSPDYHVRFDSAYYSVNHAYLYKEVLIRVSAAHNGEDFFQRGSANLPMDKSNDEEPVVYRYQLPPRQLQRAFRMEWDLFIGKAVSIDTNTEAVIKRILSSRKLEIQTYRMCQGVLSFTRKYSKQALEDA